MHLKNNIQIETEAFMDDPYRMIARLYDALYNARNTEQVRGDTKFYVEEALKSGGPVLELGAGTLRITLPIAASGIDMVAMDISSAMLEAAQEKLENSPPEAAQRVRLLHEDMRTFKLQQKFPLILIPFRAFQNLLTVEDQLACLKNTKRHLLPEGRLIFDIFDPRLEFLAPHPNDAFGAPMRHMKTFEHNKEVTLIVSLARTNIDYVNQTFTELWAFDQSAQDGKTWRTVQELTLRWTYRFEMQHLLENCGFRILDLFGDFSRGPFTYGNHQIWIAQNPELTSVISA